MKQPHRQKLQEKLSQMDSNDRRKLFKRAQKLRRAASRAKEKSDDDWIPGLEEDDAPARPNARRKRDSIQDWAMRLLAEEEMRVEGSDLECEAATRFGTVVANGAGTCRLRSDGEDLECVLSASIGANQSSDLAVGDTAGVSPRADGVWVVVEVKPRRTRLSRPNSTLGHLEQVIAANIDVVVVVASVRQPAFKPGLVDRYLVAVQRGGAEPVVAVTKTDLLDPGEAADLDLWRDAGVLVFPVSAETRDGVDALRQYLSGKLSVFVGQSGVGKSTLVNAFDPSLSLRTGEVRAYDGRGRHTTTGSALHEIAGGLRIIDTPGIRGFGLWDLSLDELRSYFPEFEGAACRFRDCSHTHEPVCGVKARLEAGTLDPRRYASYVRIRESLK